MGNKLYPHYGSRECGLGGAVTCPAFEGMHLRENHIIPEIIDEHGNVLPDGEYGELVLTTIGSDAMPLIRYRTGDYTRILPPCYCAGVTKRIDAVSRREEAFPIEKLDSRLFQFPWLVDYRAYYDGILHLDCFCLEQQSVEQVRTSVQKQFPQINAEISMTTVLLEHRPAYLGKRHVIRV